MSTNSLTINSDVYFVNPRTLVPNSNTYFLGAHQLNPRSDAYFGPPTNIPANSDTYYVWRLEPSSDVYFVNPRTQDFDSDTAFVWQLNPSSDVYFVEPRTLSPALNSDTYYIFPQTNTLTLTSGIYYIIEIPPPPEPGQGQEPPAVVPHNIQCDERINCGSDSPLINYSSEAEDFPGFFGRFYGSPTTQPTDPPIVGHPFTADNCLGQCVSFVSQQEADLCAQNNAVICQAPPGTPLFYNSVQSCSVKCPDGNSFTMVVAAGLIADYSQIMADRRAHAFACEMAQVNKLCLGSLKAVCCLNSAYDSTIIGSSRNTPLVMGIVSGTLPPGLDSAQTSGNTLRIFGTPTTAGPYAFSVKATDTRGSFMLKNYTISVVGITNTDPLPDGTTGTPYDQAINIIGGSGNYALTVSAGTLPDGLTLDDAFHIVGTPTGSFLTYPFTLQVEDLTYGIKCSKALSITVNGVSCPDRVQVKDYLTALTDPCWPASPSGGDSLWNGTMFKENDCDVTGGLIYNLGTSARWFGGTHQVKLLNAWINHDVGAGWWELQLFDGHGNPIWSGKLFTAANSPVGIYNYESGCFNSQATLEIIGYP